MKHIFFEIFGVCLFVILTISAVILTVTYDSIRVYYIDQLTNSIKNINCVLEPKLLECFINDKTDEIQPTIKKLGTQINARITVIDISGKVIADSQMDPNLMENHSSRPEVKEALSHNFGKSIRISYTLNEEMLYVASKIETNDHVYGILRISLFLKDINEILSNFKNKLFWPTFIIVVLSMFVLWFFSRSISEPIKELAQASREVAKGDFDTKVYLRSKDELLYLADSFNYMTEQIKNLFTQVRNQSEELNSIISAIQGPLIVLDSQGRILMTNHGFNKVIKNSDDSNGKFYWEVIRELKFYDIVKIAQKEKSFIDEISFNNKFFIVSGSYIKTQKKIVLVLYDVTELKRLEQVKKDFVLNVSHELRTPLTAIKGFLETLEDEIRENNKADTKELHYFEILNRHTSRMINLVNDLSLLSKLEDSNGSSNLELTEVDLNHTINNCMKIFEEKIKAKNLDFISDIMPDLPLLIADEYKLEQLFINLIDNAIKYTDTGYIKVRIYKNEEKAFFEVSDSGLGIPKEHHDRIFERFYTVDKSRSRQLGGTGLGLSIVKHIVMLHKGDIKVESENAKGTTFIVSIPYSS